MRRLTGFAAAAVTVALAGAPAAQAAGQTIDTSDRVAVATAYSRWIVPAVETPVGWTGSVDGCRIGTETTASRGATVSAVNYYRAMAGVPPVVENPEWSRKALEAAVMMRAADRLSHDPDAGWPCYTSGGAEAAGKSNLHGIGGAWAIADYMVDPGESNTSVGHRRWLLNPTTTRIGTGSTDGSNALWVIDPDWRWEREVPDGVDWIAWPPAGHVPWEIALVQDRGRQLFRWSLSSASHTYDADYADATVTATLTSRGRTETLRVTLEPFQAGYGLPTLVWNARRAGGGPFPVTSDATATITVSGMTDGGSQVPTHTYDVDLFRAAFADVVGTAHRHAIESLDAAGYAGGFPDGTYQPNGTVTRGQMASFLARALDLPAATGTSLTDVAGTTHAAAISAVASAGITGGYSDGTFRPGATVTRGQMATFLARAVGLPAGTRWFSDTIGTVHGTAVAAVASAGITGGYPDDTFRPQENLSRGQMATFLTKALGL